MLSSCAGSRSRMIVYLGTTLAPLLAKAFGVAPSLLDRVDVTAGRRWLKSDARAIYQLLHRLGAMRQNSAETGVVQALRLACILQAVPIFERFAQWLKIHATSPPDYRLKRPYPVNCSRSPGTPPTRIQAQSRCAGPPVRRTDP